MKTFTVHMPPPTGSAEKDALETLFVREGFAIWAFLIPLLWLIVHRMWLVFLGYIVLTGLLEGAAQLIGDIAPGIFAFLITILFGLEANNLRRWTLDRRGYRFAGIAAGRTLEDAEQRFFDSWNALPTKVMPGPGSGSGPGSGPAQSARPADRNPFGERPVAGLFPQPERPR